MARSRRARSRAKGAEGERAVVRLARAAGLPADRLAPLQAGRVPGAPDVVLYPWPELHVEVKRDERLSVDAMVRQSEQDAATREGEAKIPVVVWRRNRRAWRADVPLDWFLGVLAELHNLRATTKGGTA